MQEARSRSHGAGRSALQQPPDPHAGPTSAHTPSALVAGTARGPGGLLRSHPVISVLILSSYFLPTPHAAPQGQEGTFPFHRACTLAPLWLLGSCGLTVNRSRDTPCKVGMGGMSLPSKEKRQAGSREWNEMPHACRGWPGQVPSHLYWS